jgi:hypothetical protein
LPCSFNNRYPILYLPLDPETGTEWVLTGTTDANSGDPELQEIFKGWFMGQMLGLVCHPAII